MLCLEVVKLSLFICEIFTFAIESPKIIEKKGDMEREYVDKIGSLNVALDEEHELRESLEEKFECIDEIISKLVKERDHAIAKYKLAKKKMVEFGVGHTRLTEDDVFWP